MRANTADGQLRCPICNTLIKDNDVYNVVGYEIYPGDVVAIDSSYVTLECFCRTCNLPMNWNLEVKKGATVTVEPDILELRQAEYDRRK